MARRRPNGGGSIVKRKDGRYQGRLYVTTTSGVVKRISVYGRTWDEVDEKLGNLKHQEQSGIPTPDSDVKLTEYLQYWLEEIVRVQRRAKTHKGYESVVRVHLIPALGRKPLRKLRAQDVRVWLNRLRQECQCCAHGWDEKRQKPQCCATGRCCKTLLSTRMVQFIHAVLRNALENAVREELVMRNVAKLVTIPTPKYKLNRGLEVAQARELLTVAQDERLYALYVLALLIGLRRGELLGLHWRDVDLDGGSLEVVWTLQRVDGKLSLVPPKTEHSERTVPLPALAVEALYEHRERQARERAAAGEQWQESGLVFTSMIGTPMEPDNLRRSWHRLRTRLGLDLRFHDLRHTCVTLLLDLGVAPHIVREIVGHSDIGVTMTIYAHASLEEKRKALGKLGEGLT